MKEAGVAYRGGHCGSPAVTLRNDVGLRFEAIGQGRALAWDVSCIYIMVYTQIPIIAYSVFSHLVPIQKIHSYSFSSVFVP